METQKKRKGVAMTEKDSISFAVFALGLVWSW